MQVVGDLWKSLSGTSWQRSVQGKGVTGLRLCRLRGLGQSSPANPPQQGTQWTVNPLDSAAHAQGGHRANLLDPSGDSGTSWIFLLIMNMAVAKARSEAYRNIQTLKICSCVGSHPSWAFTSTVSSGKGLPFSVPRFFPLKNGVTAKFTSSACCEAERGCF